MKMDVKEHSSAPDSIEVGKNAVVICLLTTQPIQKQHGSGVKVFCSDLLPHQI